MYEPSVSNEGLPHVSTATLHLVSHAVAQMGPNWVMLLNVSIARDAGGAPSPPSHIGFALLHPERGIALLELAPASTLDAVARLRWALSAARFPLIFAGELPIVHRRLTLEDLPRLGDVIGAAFAGEPLISLHGGRAWTGLARRVLGGERCLDPVASTLKGDAGVPFVPPPRPPPRHPARWSHGLRALGYFWLAATVALISGAAFLQYTYVPPVLSESGRVSPIPDRPPR